MLQNLNEVEKMVTIRKITALFITSMLLASVFAAISTNCVTTATLGDANLTGNIFDSGKDTDGDGKFDYLEVSVEVNVTVSGHYWLSADYLIDQNGSTLFMQGDASCSLEPGARLLNMSYYGPRIYACHFNPKSILEIDLYGNEYLGNILNVSLSRVYNYNEFESMAFLTCNTRDEGIDSDGDGLINWLKIGVELNVTCPDNYNLVVNGLRDAGYANVWVMNNSWGYLTSGIHMVNVTLFGADIYTSHLNVVTLIAAELQTSDGHQVQELRDRPLSRMYRYDEFDPLAILAEVSDFGVDKDGNGLFDYLSVGMEINVTDPGEYSVCVRQLADDTSFPTCNLYVYEDSTKSLSVGLQTVFLNFSGPMIASNNFNPTSVCQVYLENVRPYVMLQYASSIALPTLYNSAQFDSPMNDMQLEFTVYPNATVDLTGNFNRTRIYPVPAESRFNATFGISTSGNLTAVALNGTMTVPPYAFDAWPYNSTTASLLAQIQNGILNAQLSTSTLMPPAADSAYPMNASSGDLTFQASYTNGLVTVSLDAVGQLCPELQAEFPFNVTDFTVVADYRNKQIAGNITFRTVSGFPLGDVIVHFRGNETHVFLTGYLNVIYGNYFGVDYNAAYVEEMRLNYTNYLPGQGNGSVYNMTGGLVECTSLDTTSTPFGPPDGTRIDYNATLAGNFTSLLAKVISEMFSGGSNENTFYAALDSTFSSVQNATLRLNYYNASKIADLSLRLSSNVKELWTNAIQTIPATVPIEAQNNVWGWLHIANVTAYAIDNGNVEAVYSHDQKRLNITASLTANFEQFKDDVKPYLPDIVPPELHDSFEDYLNVTYCEFKLMTLSCNFTYGTAEFAATCMLEGDFNAQLNHGKGFGVQLFKMLPYAADWAARFINATEVDVDNFRLNVRQGEDWELINFSGIRMHPRKDDLDFIRFKLYSWLHTTDDPDAPPKRLEKLKITMAAGFNGTHTVLLSAPGTGPIPDVTGLDYKEMVWENVTMDSLKDLLFKVAYQGVADYGGATYYVPIFTNSTASGFSFDHDAKKMSFNVTGALGTGFCNITIPKALLYADPADWVIQVDSTVLDVGNYNVTENAEYVFIYFMYSHSSHTVQVQGTWVVTEFQPNLLPLILAAISLIAAAITYKQRRRLGVLKLKYQHMARMFAARLRR